MKFQHCVETVGCEYSQFFISVAASNKYLSYRRETALQGGLVMAKSGRLEPGDNIYVYYNSIFNHFDVFGQQSKWIRWKTQKRAITLFKVIQGHRGWYQSKARMRLPINSNWQPISYRCGVFAAYCSNFGHCVFEPPFRGGLGTV